MSALTEVRSHLPFWVAQSALSFYLPACFVAGLVLARLAMLVALAPPPDASAPWYERARWLFPARALLPLSRTLLPIACGSWGMFFDTPLQWLQQPLLSLAGAAVAYLGTWPTAAWLQGMLPDPPNFGQRSKDVAARLLIFLPHLWLSFAIAPFASRHADLRNLLLLSVWAGGLFGAFRGDTLYVARWLRLASAGASEVVAQTIALAGRMGVRTPMLFELHVSWANAAAFVVGGKVCYSRRLRQLLTPDELEAVLAHELAHLAEPPGVRIFRSAGLAFFLLPVAFVRPLLEWGWEFAAMAGGTSVLLALLLRKLARQMEERADRIGRAHESETAALARGLEKVYRANLYPVVVSGRTPHPSLYDRLTAAGCPPPYARPPPPQARRRWAGVLILFLPFFANVGFAFLLPTLQRKAWRSERGVLSSLAFTGHTAWKLGELARLHHRARDRLLAEVLYRGAAELDPSPLYFANLALLLASDARCTAAARALEEAQTLDCDGENTDFLASVRRAVDRCE